MRAISINSINSISLMRPFPRILFNIRLLITINTSMDYCCSCLGRLLLLLLVLLFCCYSATIFQDKQQQENTNRMSGMEAQNLQKVDRWRERAEKLRFLHYPSSEYAQLLLRGGDECQPNATFGHAWKMLVASKEIWNSYVCTAVVSVRGEQY